MKYDYGDSVRITSSELAAAVGFESGSVCGFREIADQGGPCKIGWPVGTILVLVEGAEGQSAEIPEEQLSLL